MLRNENEGVQILQQIGFDKQFDFFKLKSLLSSNIVVYFVSTSEALINLTYLI